MTTTTHTNGKPQRKQLSDQLDRLDRIIDVMVDDLPDAVAAATRDGTRQAIRDVLTEVLTDPDVLSRLRTTLLSVSPLPVPPKPSVITPVPALLPKPDRFARFKSAVRSGYQKVAEEVKAVAAPAKAVVTKTKQRVVTAALHVGSVATQVITATRMLKTTIPLSRFLVVALAVCVAVTVTSYLLPHPVSAILSGAGGAVMTLTLQLGAWLRRSARSFGFPTA